MKEKFSLGTTPHDEPCIQMGDSNYRRNSNLECLALIAQLRRERGPEPSGASYKITSNSHDFGNYLDVEIEFEEDNEEAVEFALMIESEIPAKWDSQSLDFLKENSYSLQTIEA
jgi:hypothetical protein